MSSKPLKNPRHEAFARHYVAYGVARHAYVAAGYQARLGDDPRATYPADVNASRLLKHAQVDNRVNALRRAMAKRADITEDSIATELEEARQLAKSEGQSAAMVSATVAKAKLAGLMIERKEVGEAGDFARMSEQELRDYIASQQLGYLADTQEPAALPAPTHAEHKREQ